MADRSYRVAPPDVLRTESLGELTAIFDRRSMQTHVVAPPMPEILTALRDGPCRAAELMLRLAAHFDLEQTDEAAAILAERLVELAVMGLVEPL